MDQGRPFRQDPILDIAGDPLPRPIRRDAKPGKVAELRRPPLLPAQEEAVVPEIEVTKRTGQATLDLVKQSAQVLKVAEDRGHALAERGHEIAQRAVSELKAAEARIKVLEERLRKAEQRAKEAEDWLVRIHESIKKNLVGQELSEPLPAGEQSVSAA